MSTKRKRRTNAVIGMKDQYVMAAASAYFYLQLNLNDFCVGVFTDGEFFKF